MATFTWIPDQGAKKTFAPRIKIAQFGEGYAQRSADGLNANMKPRMLNFTVRSMAESKAIQAFLEAQGGTTSFDYAHPDDISRKYICAGFEATDNGCGSEDISCVFVQVPR